jgi:uncharacterized protein
MSIMTPALAKTILAIDERPGVVRLTDVASRVGISLSSAQRVLESLQQSSAITKSSSTRPRYRPADGYPWDDLVRVARRELGQATAGKPSAIAAHRAATALARLPATDDAKTWLPIVVDRIVKRFHPQRVILFGSQAYGLPRSDSDVDLLVVDDAATDRRALTIALLRELRDLPIAKDILVTTTHAVPPRGSVLDQALRKGATLYDVRA